MFLRKIIFKYRQLSRTWSIIKELRNLKFFKLHFIFLLYLILDIICLQEIYTNIYIFCREKEFQKTFFFIKYTIEFLIKFITSKKHIQSSEKQSHLLACHIYLENKLFQVIKTSIKKSQTCISVNKKYLLFKQSKNCKKIVKTNIFKKFNNKKLT